MTKAIILAISTVMAAAGMQDVRRESLDLSQLTVPQARLPAGCALSAGLCNGSPEATVPAFVLKAAETGTIMDFASVLAEARVCAGFVVSSEAPGAVTASWRYEPTEPPARITDALRAFLARHKNFVVERIGSVLLIHDRRDGLKAAPFNKVAQRLEVVDKPAIDAFWQVVAAIAPQSAPPGGHVSSVLGKPDEPPPTSTDLLGPNLNTSLANATLLDMLVDLAGRAPGVVWMLKSVQADGRTTATSPTYELICFLPRGLRRAIGGPIE